MAQHTSLVSELAINTARSRPLNLTPTQSIDRLHLDETAIKSEALYLLPISDPSITNSVSRTAWSGWPEDWKSLHIWKVCSAAWGLQIAAFVLSQTCLGHISMDASSLLPRASCAYKPGQTLTIFLSRTTKPGSTRCVKLFPRSRIECGPKLMHHEAHVDLKIGPCCGWTLILCQLVHWPPSTSTPASTDPCNCLLTYQYLWELNPKTLQPWASDTVQKHTSTFSTIFIHTYTIACLSKCGRWQYRILAPQYSQVDISIETPSLPRFESDHPHTLVFSWQWNAAKLLLSCSNMNYMTQWRNSTLIERNNAKLKSG